MLNIQSSSPHTLHSTNNPIYLTLFSSLFLNCISENWNPRNETFSGTRDPRPVIHLMGETWNPIFGTLTVGSETRDRRSKLKVEPGTGDPRPLMWDARFKI